MQSETENGVGGQLYNKIPQTGWFTNNKSVFLTVLKTRSPRSGCRHVEVRVADFSLCPHIVLTRG